MYLVLVHYPAPCFLVFALVEPLVLHDLVHRDVLQPCCARKLLCVCCLAYTGGSSEDDVWTLARHCVGIERAGLVRGDLGSRARFGSGISVWKGQRLYSVVKLMCCSCPCWLSMFLTKIVVWAG